MKNIKIKTPKFFIGLLAGVFIATAGVAFATWQAHWWGTDWIQSGEIISARKVAENFEYLYDRTSTSTNFKNPPTCTGENKALQWDGDTWVCADVEGGGGGSSGNIIASGEKFGNTQIVQDTFTITSPGVLLVSSYIHTQWVTTGGGGLEHASLYVNNKLCTKYADPGLGGGFSTSLSCVKILTPGTYTIKSVNTGGQMLINKFGYVVLER